MHTLSNAAQAVPNVNLKYTEPGLCRFPIFGTEFVSRSDFTIEELEPLVLITSGNFSSFWKAHWGTARGVGYIRQP